MRGTKIMIGDGVFIDAFVKLRVAGGSGDVTIGPNCYINALGSGALQRQRHHARRIRADRRQLHAGA